MFARVSVGARAAPAVVTRLCLVYMRSDTPGSVVPFFKWPRCKVAVERACRRLWWVSLLVEFRLIAPSIDLGKLF